MALIYFFGDAKIQIGGRYLVRKALAPWEGLLAGMPDLMAHVSLAGDAAPTRGIKFEGMGQVSFLMARHIRRSGGCQYTDDFQVLEMWPDLRSNVWDKIRYRADRLLELWEKVEVASAGGRASLKDFMDHPKRIGLLVMGRPTLIGVLKALMLDRNLSEAAAKASFVSMAYDDSLKLASPSGLRVLTLTPHPCGHITSGGVPAKLFAWEDIIRGCVCNHLLQVWDMAW